MEYFAFYGITPSLLIDESALRKAFIAKQREWHPDFFAADPAAYETAMAHTTLNNQAFNALKSFDNRLEYILKSRGWANEGEKNVLPPAFLAEMMDLNDLIEAGISGNMDAKVSAALQIEKLQEVNNEKMNELATKFLILNSAPTDFWDQLQSCYQMQRYLSRLRKNIDGEHEI